jgi:hypothetical protein
MAVVMVDELGRPRGPEDGSRRYTPIAMTFDTRAMLLDLVTDGPDVEPETATLNRNNQSRLREELIHEFGAANYEQKVQNFVDLGPAPWSLAALHNTYLSEVRQAFSLGAYYPALVGACALGERILNHLVLTLREDYASHPATKHVAGKKALDDWEKCIRTLEEWGVATDDVKGDYRALEDARHAAVHYRTELDTGNARAAALCAIRLLSGVVEKIFNPHGIAPHYFAGPIGRAYVRLEAESDPFIRRFILPACALVSPRYRFVPSGRGFDIYDDPDYGTDRPPLTDEEFADSARASPQVEYPF